MNEWRRDREESEKELRTALKNKIISNLMMMMEKKKNERERRKKNTAAANWLLEEVHRQKKQKFEKEKCKSSKCVPLNFFFLSILASLCFWPSLQARRLTHFLPFYSSIRMQFALIHFKCNSKKQMEIVELLVELVDDFNDDCRECSVLTQLQ